MPGPCNQRKRKKIQAKKARKSGSSRSSLDSSSPSVLSNPVPLQPSPIKEHHSHLPDDEHGGLMPQTPYIHDPGNGPRVRDTRAFLSSFFAQPPSLDDPLCAEFAQEEVCQMLFTVLPEETALILWYNKSRAKGRICPACQRLYRLGDILQGHIQDEHEYADDHQSVELAREQEISGLCSPVCFILASFNYPGAIKSTWGRMADELSSHTWNLLNSPGEGHGDRGLGMLLKMTRLEDLGLGQLCLPDVDFDSDYDSDPSQLERDLGDSGEVDIGPLENHTSSVWSMNILNDSKHIRPASCDHTIGLYAKARDVGGWERSMRLARRYIA